VLDCVKARFSVSTSVQVAALNSNAALVVLQISRSAETHLSSAVCG